MLNYVTNKIIRAISAATLALASHHFCKLTYDQFIHDRALSIFVEFGSLGIPMIEKIFRVSQRTVYFHGEIASARLHTLQNTKRMLIHNPNTLAFCWTTIKLLFLVVSWWALSSDALSIECSHVSDVSACLRRTCWSCGGWNTRKVLVNSRQCYCA